MTRCECGTLYIREDGMHRRCRDCREAATRCPLCDLTCPDCGSRNYSLGQTDVICLDCDHVSAVARCPAHPITDHDPATCARCQAEPELAF